MEFAEAIESRMQDAASKCVECGKCFEVCPMKESIGLADAEPKEVLDGIVGLIRGSEGNDAAIRWAGGCSSSGLCRSVCEYGVDPMFLVRMAHFSYVRRRDRAEVRKNGAMAFRASAKSLRVISRLQLDQTEVSRLQPDAKPTAAPSPVDVSLYLGCNVGKTPHIVKLCLEILQAMGLTCGLVGGATSCCGINQFKAGDAETGGRAGLAVLGQIEGKQATTNLTWCPTCQVQFETTIIPARQLMTGRDDFGMTPFFVFLKNNLDKLKPLFKYEVRKRVALNERPGAPDVVHAVEQLLRAIPGVELVRLDVRRLGLQAGYLNATPKLKESVRNEEFAAAALAGVTTLATIFHACHRDLVKFENAVSFEIINVIEVIGASMGLHAEDTYKRLALAQSVEAAVDQSAQLLEEHGLSSEEAKNELSADMYAEKPLYGRVFDE